MKLTKLALFALPVVLFGCPTDEEPDTDTSETGDVEETDTPETDTDPMETDMPALELAVTFATGTPDTITLSITNGSEDYDFGMAQTAVEAAGGTPWYGEDCYEGTGSFQFCHPVGQTGATLSKVETTGEIVEGSTTLIPVDTPALTYVLLGATDCWVWGDDITYYAGIPEGPCAEYMAPM